MTVVAGKRSYKLNITDQSRHFFDEIAEGCQVSVSNNILM